MFEALLAEPFLFRQYFSRQKEVRPSFHFDLGGLLGPFWGGLFLDVLDFCIHQGFHALEKFQTGIGLKTSRAFSICRD